MIIRPARKDEVTKLQILNDEVFIDNQKYDGDLDMGWAKSKKGRRYFTKLLNNPLACCFLAEEDGNPVGYIAAAPKVVDYCKSKYFEIENMGVIPKYRSKGIGSQLVQKCLSWAREKGFQKMYVSAYYQNTKAVTFYKSGGFGEIDLCLERNI